jgi:hypothetical protein
MKRISHPIGYFALVVLLFLPTLLSASTYNDQHSLQDDEPIKPLLDTEDVAVLSAEDHSLAKFAVEIAFRQIKYDARNISKKYTCFVEINGKNPPTDIIDGLGDDHVKVKPACMGMLKGIISSVYDPQSDLAELVSLDNIHIFGENATIEVSFHQNFSLGAHGCKYFFVRKNGKWEFVRSQFMWLS